MIVSVLMKNSRYFILYTNLVFHKSSCSSQNELQKQTGFGPVDTYLWDSTIFVDKTLHELFSFWY